MKRKGLGLGKGSGYYNIIPQYDSYVHSLSAKGVKSYLKKPKFIETKGNEKITITCPECGTKFSNWSNIFEGKETSYICPKCRYEGYAYPKITKINAKGKKTEVQQIVSDLKKGKLDRNIDEKYAEGFWDLSIQMVNMLENKYITPDELQEALYNTFYEIYEESVKRKR